MNLFDVGAVTVQDIMVPRARIESIKLDDDIETIVHHLVTSYHQRLPVFRSALGEVVGVLQLKKVLAALPTGTLDKEALQGLLSEPYFVPASTPVLSQMQYFQENRERIALVVDEYGELMGLVTLEDIIEELLGEIVDEFDVEDPMIEPLPGGDVLVNARMPLDEVNDLIHAQLPEGDWDTIGGLLLSELGHVPTEGECVEVGGWQLTAQRVQGRRIGRIRLHRVLAFDPIVTEPDRS
jgi:CBS domain containing-hemolysin-like protein